MDTTEERPCARSAAVLLIEPARRRARLVPFVLVFTGLYAVATCGALLTSAHRHVRWYALHPRNAPRLPGARSDAPAPVAP